MCRKDTQFDCPLPDISAYLDGELSAPIELELEQHLAVCRVCSDELNLQKGFLNALATSLESDRNMELPSGFARSVIANAESRVDGLRQPNERRRAIIICVALTAFAVLALGSKTETLVFATASVVENLFAVATSAWNVFYNLALGSTIVFRSIGSAFMFDSAATVVLVGVVFATTLYFFSRLLSEFRRI